MNEYAQISGLKFNKAKCGSIQSCPSIVTSHVEISSTNLSLPDKDIRWGLLTLKSSGCFTIDQEPIKPFLDEMQKLF